MAILKVAVSLPKWQDKIIRQVIKEEKKDYPNHDLLNRAKDACIKTQDENFMFAFAYYSRFSDIRTEIVESLLKINAIKWAIPCVKEITSWDGFGLPVINANICVDALLKVGNAKVLCDFAKKIGHSQKIEDYLIEEVEVDLLLDYAKNVKGANINKIGEFIKDYYLSTSDNEDILKKFQKIHQSKIKKCKTLQDSLDLMGDDLQM